MKHALIGVIVGAWLAGGQPPDANRDVTVDQLRAVVVEAAHERDAEIARRITPLHLTERLTAAGVEKIDDALHLGPETQAALRMLADSSAFLDPPPAEIPARATPSIAEQQTMINGAVHFVAVTQRRLPDFSAARTTYSFDDRPTLLSLKGWATAGTMHADGDFSQEITFRDGKEGAGTQQARASSAGKDAILKGLTSTGEFGTLQGVILLDMVHGKLAWSHWETTHAGAVAVFQYDVSEAQSHYVVDYCCVRNYADSESYSPVSSNLPNSYHGTPGYHGTLSIDPATGAIMRITVEASLKSSEPITDGAVAIDYGPVTIGDKSYICPVHSVAISVVRSQIEGLYAPRAVRRINEVEFTNYHPGGATAQMVMPAASQ
jgi:hypothetical protein